MSIEQLERKIQELENTLRDRESRIEELLQRSEKAMDTALHAYKLDAYGFLWTYNADTKLYVRTKMRVMSPEIVERAVKAKNLADNCIEGRHLLDDILEGRHIKGNTIEGRSIADGAVDNSKLAPNAVTSRNLAPECITGDDLPGDIPNGKLANDAVQTRNIKDRNVTSSKIGKDAILPEHVSPATFRELAKDLQNQIDALEIAGVAVSNEFGTDPHISVSQKTMTDAINKIWQKFEDITGEILQGVNMIVTPEYFISEDGTDVHITANTVDTNGIFEHIAFYGNGALIAEASNVDYFEHDLHIDETTVIMCKAKILGVEHTRQSVITHYNSFWLGAGNVYSDIMDVEHVIPITNGMRGAYDVHVEEGQKIIIIVGESLADGFLRADLNSVEIPFTESTVTVDNKNYKVFVSEPWLAGDYNIDING